MNTQQNPLPFPASRPPESQPVLPGSAPAASLADLCRSLEEHLPGATPEILAGFDLLTGHPWAHHAAAPEVTYYACLFGLAAAWRARRILEVGTGFGLSAAALLAAAPGGVELFVSLDLGIFGAQSGMAESNLEFARRKLHAWCDRQGLPRERVRLFAANTQPPGRSDNDNVACEVPFWRDLPELMALLEPASFDLIFLDGKHTEDGLQNDLESFWPYLRPGGLLICDDLHDESYQGIFPWAGETRRCFEAFLTAHAEEISQHHLWPFPRVLPPGPGGLRPFGLLEKRQTPVEGVRALRPAVPCEPDFAGLIHTLGRSQGRLYYRDQTPASLGGLIRLAEAHQPTVIVELGTLAGLSLRAWLAAPTQARVVAVDRSFAALRATLKDAPLDLSRVTLLEQDILSMDFGACWEPQDRVLLYVDAHDQPQAPLMESILDRALPLLPPGSRVVVDDLWHSPEPLDASSVPAFFSSRVLPEIDPLQCFDGHYAPYWQGGSFFGFREVGPLLDWVNRRRLSLEFSGDAKFVSFPWPPADGGGGSDQPTPEAITGLPGRYAYHPLAAFALTGQTALSLSEDTLAALARFSEARSLYAQGHIAPALSLLAEANARPHGVSGLRYAEAVALTRLGRFAEAIRALEAELQGDFPHVRAAQLLADLRAWNRDRPPETTLPPREAARPTPPEVPSFTIFACPKAFTGHTGIIQRNALVSWTKLRPRPDIILLGDDPGVAEIARELNLRHLPDIQRTEAGTPLVPHLFALAQETARTPVLAYVNADIILTADFAAAVRQAAARFPEYLLVGRRFDLELPELWDFSPPDWEARLRQAVAARGTLHAESAIDYFVFTRGLWPAIPDFALGRTAWDNWLVADPLLRGVPVIDATPAVLAVHQRHDYGHVPGGEAAAWRGAEARKNQDLAWAGFFLCYPTHATWELTPAGLKERPDQTRGLTLMAQAGTHLKEQRWGTALKCLEEAGACLPQGVPGWQYARALALRGLGRWQEALAALSSELASHPSHHPARELAEELQGRARPEAPVTAGQAPDPRLSVVIPTYNRARYLAAAVESALAQECPELEILVVDDGSTDDTPAVMARFTDPRVRYLPQGKSGAPGTRNTGAAQARAEWLLWLDSDDTLLPGWVARLLRELTWGEAADVYYGNLVVTNEHGKPLRTLRYDDYAGKNAALLARLVYGNPLPLPGTLMRRSLLLAAGGFDPAFPRAHDYELWTRLAPRARFRHVNFLAATWRWHDGNLSSGTVARDLSYEAEVVRRLLKRHSLKELFPDLNWEDWQTAQAQAAGVVSEILARYGDGDGARLWQEEARGRRLPSPAGGAHAARA